MLGVFLGTAPTGSTAFANDLVIYTYSSFASGVAPGLKRAFEAITPACRVEFVSAGDGAQLANRLEVESPSRADAVVGLDALTLPRVQHRVEGEWIALDFAPLGWLFNERLARRRGLKEPKTWNDLLKPEYRREIALSDPRTSTPGLLFLLASADRFGGGGSPEFESFWKALRPQLRVLAPSWDVSYALFRNEQVLLVWSYATSEAYHQARGETDRRVIYLDGVAPTQREGATRIKAAPGRQTPERKACLERWMTYLTTSEAKQQIARANWMLPVGVAPGVTGLTSVRLPERETQSTKTPPSVSDQTLLLKKWLRALRQSGIWSAP